MADQEATHSTIAPLRNVAALTELIFRVKERSLGLPGMATFYGPSGFGKSFAAIYATNKFDAICVQVKSVWTKKTLCEAILREMSVPAAGTISGMLDQISESLAISDRPLLIDEADFLVQRKMIEIVRDIYEGSQAPVILIGEERLPQKLREWERVHGRMLDWVPAQPGDLSDVGHLARIYCPTAEVSKELQGRVLKAAHASVRRICVNLALVSEHARLKGLKRVGVEDWGNRAFFTGDAPEIRRFPEASGRRAG